MASSSPRSVLVVGATGYFGQLLVEELLAFTDARIVVAGRDQARLDDFARRHEESGRITKCIADLEHPETVAAALEGIRIAICAAGPFQLLPLTLPRLCLERSIAYIDLSDDRRFTAEVHDLAARSSRALPPICSGWSAVPALAGVLARIAVEDIDPVASIDIQIAPGNRMPRAQGTVASLLHSIGKPFRVWRDGQWKQVRGWSDPRPFDFPNPVGRRIGYLVDVPAHDSLAALFPLARVEFRVGSELRALNHGVSLLSLIVGAGLVRSLVPWTRVLRTAMAATGSFGTDAGGVGVEAEGPCGNQRVRRRVCIVSEKRAQTIPVMPATIMTARVLESAEMPSGIVPVERWTTRGDLEMECERRGFRLVVEKSAT